MNARTRIACLITLCAIAATHPPRARADLFANLPPVADTTLFETAPDNNLGATDRLIVGTTAGGYKNRSLFKFDLSALPATATITSAAFTFTIMKSGAGSGSDTFTIYRVLRNWGEGAGAGPQGAPANAGEVTWTNRFHPDTPWNTPGGAAGLDFSSGVSGSVAVTGAASYTIGSTPDLVADVQRWVGNPGTNFGWILISGAEASAATARRIPSRENLFEPQPVLALQYTIPAAPTLFNLALIGNLLRFSFNAESNRPYAVEHRDALTNGNWSVLTNIPALPAAATLHITNVTSGTQRFFRARTP